MCEVKEIGTLLDELQAMRGDTDRMRKLLSEGDPCQSCSEADIPEGAVLECSCRRQYKVKLQNEFYLIRKGISGA